MKRKSQVQKDHTPERAAKQPSSQTTRRRPAVTDAQLRNMAVAIEDLEIVLDRSEVIVQAMVDRMKLWAESGYINGQYASSTVAGFTGLSFMVNHDLRSHYRTILSTWHAISPGISKYMAGDCK